MILERKNVMLSIIVAKAKNNIIGKDNKLLKIIFYTILYNAHCVKKE